MSNRISINVGAQSGASLPPRTGSASDRERLKAKMDGACAALEGRKLDANQYPEDSDLHFEWLAGWVSAKTEMRKTPNDKLTHGGENQ